MDQNTPQPAQPIAATVNSAAHPHIELFAILAIVLPFVGMAVPGIVFGFIARSWAKADGASTTLPTVGIVLSIIGTIIGLGLIIFFAFVFSNLFGTCHDLGPGVHQVGNSTYTCS